jgi:hypothetical protein
MKKSNSNINIKLFLKEQKRNQLNKDNYEIKLEQPLNVTKTVFKAVSKLSKEIVIVKKIVINLKNEEQKRKANRMIQLTMMMGSLPYFMTYIGYWKEKTKKGKRNKDAPRSRDKRYTYCLVMK